MSEIIINVEGKNYVVDRQKILTWLQQNGKVFTNTSGQFNEVSKIDDQGRSILNG